MTCMLTAPVQQIKGEYAPYYRHSLLYLACVDIDKDLTPQQRFERAKYLSLSALLADSIYNFGELVRNSYWTRPPCCV